MAKAADNSDEFESDEEKGSSRNPCSPQTPVLLWIIIFALVILMVAWSIKKFGTRSSAEGESHTPAGVRP